MQEVREQKMGLNVELMLQFDDQRVTQKKMWMLEWDVQDTLYWLSKEDCKQPWKEHFGEWGLYMWWDTRTV